MSSLRDRYGAAGLEQGRRRTLKTAISCVGTGLHGGIAARLRLVPAEAGNGIVFHRTDLGVSLPARHDHVVDTRLCTVLGLAGSPAARVGTVEHLMAAIAAAGIDDLDVEIDGPEVPILDGSAEPFLFLIGSAGLVVQGGNRPRIEVLRPVSVTLGDAVAELHPRGDGDAAAGLSLSLTIAFGAAAIGTQSISLDLASDRFEAELAGARTFALLPEVETMREAGLAKGGSLANAVVVDGGKVLNPEGLRWPDEFVRHKLLDVVGDLALAGAPLCARFVGRCTGHEVNNRLLRALFSDARNYRMTTAPAVEVPQLSAA